VFARLIEDDKPEQVRGGWRARDTLFADWPALIAQADARTPERPTTPIPRRPASLNGAPGSSPSI
jgi:hypothetical protein